jgi:cell division protein FtsB
MNKKLIIIFGSLISALLIIIIAIFGYNQYQQVKAHNAKVAAQKKAEAAKIVKEKTFDIVYESFVLDSKDLATAAEDIGSKYVDVWNKVIFDGSVTVSGVKLTDFNDALSAQSLAFSTHGNLDKISKKEDDVRNDFKDLKSNVTDKNRDKFNIAKSVYNALLKFDSLATSPSGSLQTYSEQFNSSDTDIAGKISSLDQ